MDASANAMAVALEEIHLSIILSKGFKPTWKKPLSSLRVCLRQNCTDTESFEVDTAYATDRFKGSFYNAYVHMDV